MKKIIFFFAAFLSISLSSLAQGVPASGVVVNNNGLVVVTITYVDSLAGTSGTLQVTTDMNGSFVATIPYIGNPSGGVSLFAYACITNCNGQNICDVTSWVPGTAMVFELNFCGGILADADGDGYDASVDCDDNNAWAYPGAFEECNNGIDNNCNGVIDEGCNGDSTLVDNDGDGYPAFADCNDNNPWVNPGAIEECNNGVDNDCDGMIDEDCGGTGCTADIILMTDSMLNGAGNAFEVWVINATDPTGSTFVWTTGDGNTLTGAYPTYTYSELGTYTLCVYMTNAAGCADTACVTFTVNPDGTVSPGGALQQTFTLNVSAAGPVSVNERVMENTLSVYPNPAQEQAMLTWTSVRNEQGKVWVYGMNGQVVSLSNYQSVSGANQILLNTADWNAGIYQVVMMSENGLKRNVQIVK
jgi:hypothetical protein